MPEERGVGCRHTLQASRYPHEPAFGTAVHEYIDSPDASSVGCDYQSHLARDDVRVGSMFDIVEQVGFPGATGHHRYRPAP